MSGEELHRVPSEDFHASMNYVPEMQTRANPCRFCHRLASRGFDFTPWQDGQELSLADTRRFEGALGIALQVACLHLGSKWPPSLSIASSVEPHCSKRDGVTYCAFVMKRWGPRRPS